MKYQIVLIGIYIATAIFQSVDVHPKPVPFADNGVLKMLYDNRMGPQAIEVEGKLYIVWRGESGYPFIATYDLQTRKFSKQIAIAPNLAQELESKIRNDHHYAPVIWLDSKKHIHFLFGCHNSPGIHVKSKKPVDIQEWEQSTTIHDILSYPQVHQIYNNQTLIYFRHKGHLGYWTYRLTKDNGESWHAPNHPLVDLNREPHDGLLASHAGSYHISQLSRDGKTLHIAFIWKVEEPIFNPRYQSDMDEYTRRYNLYYLILDLELGTVSNYDGQVFPSPIRKKTADNHFLIWDTENRVIAYPSSLYVDQSGYPTILVAVSQHNPYDSTFYVVSPGDNGWTHSPITTTSQPWNAAYLDQNEDQSYRAIVIKGKEKFKAKKGMNFYGWGEAIEEWISINKNFDWKFKLEIKPIQGFKYQNVKPVFSSNYLYRNDIFLFYGWENNESPGTAFLWDRRK